MPVVAAVGRSVIEASASGKRGARNRFVKRPRRKDAVLVTADKGEDLVREAAMVGGRCPVAVEVEADSALEAAASGGRSA